MHHTEILSVEIVIACSPLERLWVLSRFSDLIPPSKHMPVHMYSSSTYMVPLVCPIVPCEGLTSYPGYIPIHTPNILG